ncbi:hypothetical protein EVAR_97888_1 [Eumeta japonica]|uniref:Uncharacterized protein n=1 Tax=Eumeta variegata TaxID=151549 RepID=A0A4C1WEP0_EUMVA|nr:hypothetical protein EVAR_97888_1 [Eumeta japonica]
MSLAHSHNRHHYNIQSRTEIAIENEFGIITESESRVEPESSPTTKSESKSIAGLRSGSGLIARSINRFRKLMQGWMTVEFFRWSAITIASPQYKTRYKRPRVGRRPPSKGRSAGCGLNPDNDKCSIYFQPVVRGRASKSGP